MCEFTHTQDVYHTPAHTASLSYSCSHLKYHSLGTVWMHRDDSPRRCTLTSMFLITLQYKPGPNRLSSLPCLCVSVQNPDNQTAPANRGTQTSNHRPMVHTHTHTHVQTLSNQHTRIDSIMLISLNIFQLWIQLANTLTQMLIHKHSCRWLPPRRNVTVCQEFLFCFNSINF